MEFWIFELSYFAHLFGLGYLDFFLSLFLFAHQFVLLSHFYRCRIICIINPPTISIGPFLNLRCVLRPITPTLRIAYRFISNL